MRIFLMLLIFAIGFSGYSAAAHAFGPDSCDTETMSQIADNGTNASDCSGHQADQDKQTDTNQSKSSKAKCMDCVHCCASHAISLSNYNFDLPEPEASRLSPSLEASHNSDFITLMLRPPRFLI